MQVKHIYLQMKTFLQSRPFKDVKNYALINNTEIKLKFLNRHSIRQCYESEVAEEVERREGMP
jgi:hypothetical protein